ncbi:hypothetical protein [Streptomyces yanii]|uniref:Uncharacterized protein n=1 Tax=Streptomyces yanii TaxID=78510 RepID=A0ABV5R8V1_9ACTN
MRHLTGAMRTAVLRLIVLGVLICSGSLVAAGLTGADKVLPVTFLVIVGTVRVYGLTARAVAARLGVARPTRTRRSWWAAIPGASPCRGAPSRVRTTGDREPRSE